MKIILLQDIKKIGRKFEVKEVSPGYARNFLFPKKLAQPADSKSLSFLATQKEKNRQKALELTAKQAQITSNLINKSISISVPVGPHNELYAAINEDQVISALKDQLHIFVDSVIISEPLKSLGTHIVHVRVGDKSIPLNVEVTKNG